MQYFFEDNTILFFLSEEDVTLTMYTAAYNRSAPEPRDGSTSKVDIICDAVKKALSDFDDNR